MCPYFERRCCFSVHPMEEVSAASLVEQDTGRHGDVPTDALFQRFASLEHIAEVMKALPQEPIQETVREQIVAATVPQLWEISWK